MRVRIRREAIRSAETERQARRRGLAARLCLAAATLGLLVLCSSAQAVEVPLLTGATGPTGPAGPAGPQGERGPTGPAGGGGSGSGRETSAGTLESKKQETGGWLVSISASSGAQQVQAGAVLSFPIPLSTNAKYTVTYRNAEQSLAPEAPCFGSVDEPNAVEGNLCVYRGGASFGSLESEDKNVTNGKGANPAPFFEDFFGEEIPNKTATSGEANQGDLGIDLVFRTLQFNAAGGAPATLTSAAYTAAHGSWAIRTKE